VTTANPEATQEELSALAKLKYDSSAYPVLAACLTQVVTLAVFGFIYSFNTIKKLLMKAFNLNTLKYGCIGVGAIFVFSVLYNLLIILPLGLGMDGNANQEGVVKLVSNNLVLGFIWVVLLAPFAEELTYRYSLFGAFIKKKKWIAYAISGLVFMLMHSVSSFLSVGFSKELLSELVYLPPYLFSGLVLCYVYDKTNNIGSSFIAHVLNNLISFLGML
jgi:membrane protease YdiL (CAAX protease family)